MLGFNGAPEAGDRFAVVENEARAREVTEYRERQKREKRGRRAGAGRGSLAEMMSQLQTAGARSFRWSSRPTCRARSRRSWQALEKLGTDEVAARIIHSGVGGITESDITLAEASDAAIIGFNVRANKQAREAAERTASRSATTTSSTTSWMT